MYKAETGRSLWVQGQSEPILSSRLSRFLAVKLLRKEKKIPTLNFSKLFFPQERKNNGKTHINSISTTVGKMEIKVSGEEK